MPRKTKAQVKVWKSLTLNRIIGLIMALMISYIVGQIFVYMPLRIPFMIFITVVYMILSAAAPTNPQINFFTGIIRFLSFKASTKIYIRSECHEEATSEKRHRLSFNRRNKQ